MRILKAKDWLDIQKNAQFRYIIPGMEFVERICDKQVFSKGIKPCVDGHWDLEFVSVDKFCEDLIHIEGRLYFSDDKIAEFKCQINDIKMKDHRIESLIYKPVKYFIR